MQRRFRPHLESLEERCLPTYIMTQIPYTLGGNSLVATCINNEGQVAGTAYVTNSQSVAFLYNYSTDVMTNLGNRGERARVQ